MNTYYEKAYQMITAPEAKAAFDIHGGNRQNPRTLRLHVAWSMCLARSSLGRSRLAVHRHRQRLVGHALFAVPSLKEDLIPSADKAFSALVTDLEERGLLDSTLVVMMGEMGRTPQINNRAGRDHWSLTQSVIWAGGGVKPEVK